MSFGFAVLRPSMTNSDEALVLSKHGTLEEAMAAQKVESQRYGWAYCEARALKTKAEAGTFISRHTHFFRRYL